MSKQNLKVKQGKQTRERLLLLAKGIFAEQGYAALTLDGLINQAGLTKGAFYHHFPSKQALFEAVYIQAEEEVGARIMEASASATDPWEQLLSGCDSYLESCADPGLQRILRLDGPSVLGWERWSEIDAEFGSGKLEAFLTQLNDGNVIRISSPKAAAHLLSGAMNEATFWIAESDQTAEALKESRKTLRQLLQGIKEA
ncbi:MAG: TetR/AcrR family transcriptional regulator [Opitutales bacterium]|nr:TetR/AcrR family transcriptional regulator [Opitutales bacterium]